jgi:thymidylate synthase (FAD)
MKVTLTRLIEKPVTAIEEAASNCYDSEPTKNGRIMNTCYDSGHQSVLEFADFTFHIEGISRASSHQLVRHRHASYAQRSQRYVNEDGFKYVIPDSIKSDTEVFNAYIDVMNYIQEAYVYMTENGVPAEDARFVLPNACETVLECKMNGRELIHFMNERLCTRAQWEIRDLAKAMKKAVAEHDEQCAQFAKFFVPKCYANPKYPFCKEHKSCGLAPKLSDVYEAYLKNAAEEREAHE